MAMRKHPSRFRAIRPSAEKLEERQMLSGIVSGVNSEGDAWQLTLTGPGVISVSKQPDASGNPTSLFSASEIDTITIAGTDPLHSRLVGTVTPSGKGDGRVFFQTFNETTSRSDKGTGGNGLLSIDMPNFWLGLTAATAPTSSSGTEPSINIPDGVSTLRFGGVDTTAFFGTNPANNLANNGQSDQLRVNLGIPQFNGTRIIIDRSVSNSVAGTTTGGTTGAATQDGVTFSVQGRLGLFQANEIDGSTTNQPAHFAAAGGTIVEAATPSAATGIPGPIGFFRVGTNATNLSVLSDDKIRDFFIGGETNNVSVLAVNGTRNLYFGKGLDTTEVLTHTIDKLFANRGALNSTVIADRQIGNAEFGGDVVGTTIQAGYNQSLASDLANPTSPVTPTVQPGGQIRVTVAGNITNSVFAGSVLADPTTGQFGTPNSLNLAAGLIKARIEGTIDNSTATPDSPTAAFFAKKVILTKGPVVPPNVPEAPFSGPLQPQSLPGIPHPYVAHTVRKTKA
jgi:hypothetical protein